MLGALARRISRVLERVPPGAPERAQLWFMAWGLVLIVIWWNDNPLYGGQSETVIPAVFVGAIAGIGGALRRPFTVRRTG